MKNLFLSLTFLCLSGVVTLNAQTIFYVSPQGKDSNPGSMQKPFASLAKALVKVRTVQDSVIICLRGGTYYLSQPVVLTDKDSRTKESGLTICNYRNEPVTLSSSAVLRLKWEKYKSGIYQARVNRDVTFDQLFVNGELQRMARYPNYNPKARFLGGTSADAVSKTKAVQWLSPEGGYVHALHRAEWGDFHYRIVGKDSTGLKLEGGWQNNRRMGMHPKYRFVENIFEELDTVNEWFYNHKTRILYYYPPQNTDLKSSLIETPQLSSLIEFRGTEKKPVSNITIRGLNLTQTTRTFMDNKEPLLRSDWTIYRGGAVFMEGAEYCRILDCSLSGIGGNAIFFNNYNRACAVEGCMITNIGASAICFVGDPMAVRSPSFEYNEFVPVSKIDRTPGPKTNNYPAECLVYNNLIFNTGTVEKQSAGVELSMCQSIHVSHNTMYDMPRAGINVSEGTWGGHLIEFNDVFNTVKETGDHGSFNSWGRDRYWHPNRKTMDSIVNNDKQIALLDVVKPIMLFNNRMRCDHGWDIDLDDGSSNYIIRNNVCLNGGLKLREGVNRVVENNIMINNSFHPHVWFLQSGDIFRHNIVTTDYRPIGIRAWGMEVDYNLFADSSDLIKAQKRGTDSHSVAGDPEFVNPEEGDYRVGTNSAALLVGFQNFDMNQFGVVSPRLKMLAAKVEIPKFHISKKSDNEKVYDFMGARLKDLTTLGEQSATGMYAITGVLVLSVNAASNAARYLQPNDVILEFDGVKTPNVNKIMELRLKAINKSVNVTVFRNQTELKFQMLVSE